MPSWYLLLALVFIIANGFFVATEFAMIKVRPTQLAALAAEGSSRAKMARRITKRLDSYLSATQLGVTLASLALGWVGEPAFEHLIEPRLALFGGFRVAVAHSIAATTLADGSWCSCSRLNSTALSSVGAPRRPVP